MIPFADPSLRFTAARDRVASAVQRVMDSGVYILGPEVERFENEFVRSVGQRYGVGVGSGTDAITVALLALGIGPGDEVILPSLTAHGSAVGVVATGASLRFVEVDGQTRMLDPNSVEAAIGPNTAAILLVHLYGWGGPAAELRSMADRRSLALVEDCAQAVGAQIDGRPAGSFGDVAAFSFYPTKNLGCPGDGGLVATADLTVAERARSIRSLGWDSNRISSGPTVNSRLDELHASILVELLSDLDEQVQQRRRAASSYLALLDGLPVGLPHTPEGAAPHLFVIAASRRDELRKALANEGIDTGVHYPVPLHRQPSFRSDVSLPVTDRLCETVVSLPVQPELMADTSIPHRVAEGIAAWMS